MHRISAILDRTTVATTTHFGAVRMLVQPPYGDAHIYAMGKDEGEHRIPGGVMRQTWFGLNTWDIDGSVPSGVEPCGKVICWVGSQFHVNAIECSCPPRMEKSYHVCRTSEARPRDVASFWVEEVSSLLCRVEDWVQCAVGRVVRQQCPRTLDLLGLLVRHNPRHIDIQAANWFTADPSGRGAVLTAARKHLGDEVPQGDEELGQLFSGRIEKFSGSGDATV